MLLEVGYMIRLDARHALQANNIRTRQRDVDLYLD